MFPGLMAKTFALLSLQLTVTLLAGVGTTLALRLLHERGHPHISAKSDPEGRLDLRVDWHWLQPGFYGLLVFDVAVFIALLIFGRGDLTVGVSLLGLWSVINGVQLSLLFVNADEHLVVRVMAIAISTTVVCALFGMYSNVDVAGFEGFLYVLLLVLLAGNIVRLFVKLGDTSRRALTGLGVFVFTAYLVIDFYWLSRRQAEGVDDWDTALLITLNIYLDLVNLILNLLDLMAQ